MQIKPRDISVYTKLIIEMFKLYKRLLFCLRILLFNDINYKEILAFVEIGNILLSPVPDKEVILDFHTDIEKLEKNDHKYPIKNLLL